MLTDPQALTQMRRHYLFHKLPDAAFEELCKTALLRQVDSNQPIFQQGDSAERFYLVLSGQVKLLRLLPEGQEKLVEVIPFNHTFAEALIFNQQPFYPVSAQAVQGCELISFDAETYLGLLKQNSEACLAVMATMSMRLHKDLQEIENLTLQNAENRLMLFLVRHSKRSGANSGELTLDVPKRTLASRLSIQPETFSRLIKKMNSEGIIEESRGLINIPDLAKLYANIQQPASSSCGRCPMAMAREPRRQSTIPTKAE